MNIRDMKAGDKIAVVSNGYSGQNYRVATITKITATQVVTDDKRYNRETGKEIGYPKGRSSWSSPVDWITTLDNPIVVMAHARNIGRLLLCKVGEMKVESNATIGDIEAIVARISALAKAANTAVQKLKSEELS